MHVFRVLREKLDEICQRFLNSASIIVKCLRREFVDSSVHVNIRLGLILAQIIRIFF